MHSLDLYYLYMPFCFQIKKFCLSVSIWSRISFNLIFKKIFNSSSILEIWKIFSIKLKWFLKIILLWKYSFQNYTKIHHLTKELHVFWNFPLLLSNILMSPFLWAPKLTLQQKHTVWCPPKAMLHGKTFGTHATWPSQSHIRAQARNLFGNLVHTSSLDSLR